MAEMPFRQPAHILVVEPDVIIGMSLAEDLVELGYRVSGPCPTADEALRLLAQDRPDAAIIDPSLRDGSGLRTATAAIELGVPVVLFASSGRRQALSVLGDVPWVDKPATIEAVLQRLPATLRPADRAA